VYDPIIQGVAGMAAIQGGVANPDFVRMILPDKLSALCATQGVLAALVARGRTGQGTHVQVSMLDAAVAFQWPDTMLGLTSLQATHAAPDWDRPAGRSAAVLRAGDGKAVAYTAVARAEWQGLCDAVDMPEWVERYPTLRHRVIYKDDISAELERIFEDLTREEVIDLLRRHGVPCGPTHGPPDVLVDPQVRHNGIIFEIDRPWIGRVREVGPMVKVGLDAWEPTRGSPALGEHTDEVLREAGYGPEDITRLRDTGVVA
jgi:crotonobetainyl-CoA:carnitine CoA-transferase CaiB-like acyl-CoA transferase